MLKLLQSPRQSVLICRLARLAFHERRFHIKTFAARPLQQLNVSLNDHISNNGASRDALPSTFNPKVQPNMREERTLRDLLQEEGITAQQYFPGEHRLLCSRCHGGSTGEKSMALFIDPSGGVAKWLCHRATCGWTGMVNIKSPGQARQNGVAPGRVNTRQSSEVRPSKPQVEFTPLSPEALNFFSNRGISVETLQRNRIAMARAFCPSRRKYEDAIAFPYYRGEELVNVKYRFVGAKEFSQVKGAEKVLYGLDDVQGLDEIIVVEGEMDKLALEEAGFTNVVSVPDGAPAQVREGSLPSQEQDKKFAYLWNSRQVLDGAGRIILATDSDAPGQALAEELARRLGRERCWRVRWFPPGLGSPAAAATGQTGPQAQAALRKDANEVLVVDGAAHLQKCIDQAQPYPIRGLFRFSDFASDIWTSYTEQQSGEQGVSTGWASLDKYYKVVPGELTIVTGVPNSGKSEWIDALLCNLARDHGWSFAMCSMEKKVKDHARQILEKHIGKPFFDGWYAQNQPRMTEKDVQEGLAWLEDRFYVIRHEDDGLPSVDWVLDLARAAVLRYGIRGLVIDPYNELDHARPSSVSETEYVSQMLSKLKRFANYNDVHVWFVAHPRQLRDWKGDPPNLYDISGSAHFINKADNGLVIHRSRNRDQDPYEVQILIRKVRNKAAGTIGDTTLRYDPRSGRYFDVQRSS
eukprot:jgi/Botrbrau1/13727/Bobra.0356s0007.1